MSVGILYEAKEWSSYKILGDINKFGVKAELIDMEEDANEDEILSHDLIVNRIAASAPFRGHQKSLLKMPKIIKLLKDNCIQMINPYESHKFEVSKEHSTSVLLKNGFKVPKVYGVTTPKEFEVNHSICYPCVVKPNCGGRTKYTFIVNNEKELKDCLKSIPNIMFILEEYLKPEYGFLTRIEVIDHECKFILKKSITDNGLAAYCLGSKYSTYEDCSNEIRETAIKAMDTIGIETGSLDIIENSKGFFIIDVNTISNTSKHILQSFSYDIMKETAAYIVKKHKLIFGN